MMSTDIYQRSAGEQSAINNSYPKAPPACMHAQEMYDKLRWMIDVGLLQQAAEDRGCKGVVRDVKALLARIDGE